MALYAFEARQPRVGKGSFVAESAMVIGDVEIGTDVYVGHGVILRGDYGKIIVGNGTALEEGVIVHARPEGKTVFGQRVTVGHGAMVHNATIEDFAVIGMRSTISDFSVVGEWAIIGEMSLVKRNQKIPDGSVAVGSPARVIGKVTSEQKEFWSYGKELYIKMAQRYQAPGAFYRIEPAKTKKT